MSSWATPTTRAVVARYSPTEDPSGYPVQIRYSRKTREQYVMTESDGKATGWRAFYRNGVWETMEKAVTVRKTIRKKSKVAKKKTKVAKKKSITKRAGTPSPGEAMDSDHGDKSEAKISAEDLASLRELSE